MSDFLFGVAVVAIAAVLLYLLGIALEAIA